jgi:tRNA(Arg) A34 adenosine deaminase TadA
MASQPSARDSLSPDDLGHLRRCLELAEEALAAGDEPFGSVLVTAEGTVRAEDCNRTAGGDQTRHPEFTLARWAAQHLDVAERAEATVYTSGEHCPMCSAAHAWVGLGRIAYLASSEQLVGWLRELGVHPAPVRPLPVQEVAPAVAWSGRYLNSLGKSVPCIASSARAAGPRRSDPAAGGDRAGNTTSGWPSWSGPGAAKPGASLKPSSSPRCAEPT